MYNFCWSTGMIHQYVKYVKKYFNFRVSWWCCISRFNRISKVTDSYRTFSWDKRDKWMHFIELIKTAKLKYRSVCMPCLILTWQWNTDNHQVGKKLITILLHLATRCTDIIWSSSFFHDNIEFFYICSHLSKYLSKLRYSP